MNSKKERTRLLVFGILTLLVAFGNAYSATTQYGTDDFRSFTNVVQTMIFGGWGISNLLKYRNLREQLQEQGPDFERT